MPAGKHDITLWQGEDFELLLQYLSGTVPIDLTGYTVLSQMRAFPNTEILLTFVSQITVPTQGRVKLTALSEQVEDVERNGFYDVRMFGPRDFILVSGIVTVQKVISKP